MADLRELKRQHGTFAAEAFDYLMFRHQYTSEHPKDFKFCRSCIGDAILVICYIFRNDYWKTFNCLRENLEHVEMFEKYCMIVSVKRDERYFYNFLVRVSLIFELFMYCYNKGFYYNETARKCLGKCRDMQYFDCAGGWRRLEHTAQFIASLGRPLTLIMNQIFFCLGRNTATFSDAVQAIRQSFISKDTLEMLHSAEMRCLMQLSDIFEARVQAVEAKNDSSVRRNGASEYLINFKATPTASRADTKKSNHHIEIERVIKSYFRGCLAALNPSKEIPGGNRKNPELPNQCHVSLKCTEPAPADCPRADCPEKAMSETTAALSLEADHISENSTLDKNTTSQELCTNELEPECLNKNPELRAQNVSNLDTVKKRENELFLLAEACVTHTVDGLEVDSSDEKKQGVVEYLSPYPTSANERNERSCSPTENKRKIQLSYLHDNSLKCTEPLPAKDYNKRERLEKILSHRITAKFVDAHQNAKNSKFSENSSTQEEFSNQHTFAAPPKYSSLKESDDSSKCKQLYTSKLYSPRGKKLDEHLKKIQGENVESQNYNIIPSGDMLVCPLSFPSQDEEILTILPESSTDDEEDTDIDLLLRLLKKMGIDPEDNENSHSLRPRRLKFTKKEKLREKQNGSENVKTEMAASDSGTLSKFSLRNRHNSDRTIRDEKLHSKELIKLYKKYLIAFLDKYLKNFPQ